jgi:hypothetical protein
MRLLSPLLLYAPETYLQNIQSLAVDGLVDKPSWDKLTSRLTGEWKENTLFVRTNHSHDSTPFSKKLILGHRIVDFERLLFGYTVSGRLGVCGLP